LTIRALAGTSRRSAKRLYVFQSGFGSLKVNRARARGAFDFFTVNLSGGGKNKTPRCGRSALAFQDRIST